MGKEKVTTPRYRVVMETTKRIAFYFSLLGYGTKRKIMNQIGYTIAKGLEDSQEEAIEALNKHGIRVSINYDGTDKTPEVLPKEKRELDKI